MHLASDYIHPTPSNGRCRISVYLPEDERDVPVVICSELPTNEGSSVTYSANQIAAEVIHYYKLDVPPEWIEHHPKEATDGTSETSELIVFSSYEVKERAPYLGEPTCKSLDHEAVEALVGQEVYALSGKRDAPFTALKGGTCFGSPKGPGQGVCGTDERAAAAAALWVGEGIT